MLACRAFSVARAPQAVISAHMARVPLTVGRTGMNGVRFAGTRSKDSNSNVRTESIQQGSEQKSKEAKGSGARRGSRARRSSTNEKRYTDQPLYKYTPELDAADISFCHPHMPHPSRWKDLFAFSKEQGARYRYFVANRGTVQGIVSQLGLDEREAQGIKTTIVEAYPGPGTFTREFLLHPNVERVVSMDNVPMFLEQLEHLREDPALKHVQHKLGIIPESGYAWDSYEMMVEQGLLRHLEGRVPKLGPQAPPMDWHATSPILFFAQLPNTVHGEQLFAQIINAISSRFWLFKFGRVKLVFVCGETVSLRSLATPQESRTRAKLGATVQCLSTPRLLLPAHDLEPYADHMYPPTPSVGPRVPGTSVFIPNSNISTGLQKRKLTVLEIDPLPEPLIDQRDMDAFEFLTRNMFVLKSKTVLEGLKHVVPGAHNVLRLVAPEHPRMKDRPDDVVLPTTPIVELTNRQWASLAEAFEKWPFRPEVFVDEGRVRRGLSDYLF